MGSTSVTQKPLSLELNVFHQAIEQIIKTHNPNIEIAASHKGARFLDWRQDTLHLDSMKVRISRTSIRLVRLIPMRQTTLPADIAVKTSGRGRALLLFETIFQMLTQDLRKSRLLFPTTKTCAKKSAACSWPKPYSLYLHIRGLTRANTV